jgi:hypothetical protein
MWVITTLPKLKQRNFEKKNDVLTKNKENSAAPSARWNLPPKEH